MRLHHKKQCFVSQILFNEPLEKFIHFSFGLPQKRVLQRSKTWRCTKMAFILALYHNLLWGWGMHRKDFWTVQHALGTTPTSLIEGRGLALKWLKGRHKFGLFLPRSASFSRSFLSRESTFRFWRRILLNSLFFSTKRGGGGMLPPLPDVPSLWKNVFLRFPTPSARIC